MEENEYDCPKELLDPIYKKPMHDPVQIIKCGHTFERAFITEWVSRWAICPFKSETHFRDCSSEALCLDDIEPNLGFKVEIDRRKSRKKRTPRMSP